VILINCGATLDLVDVLQPPEDCIFYLIDSLRPLEVRNVYNGVQIKIIVLQNELGIEQKTVPEFEDIFDEEEEGGDETKKEDEEEDEEDDDGYDREEDDNEDDEDEEARASSRIKKAKAKRKRFDPDYLEKMHKKREWEDKRSKILFEYYKYTYNRCASSLVMFDLAWKSAKDNNDLLWWSIIGVTDQLINCKIDKDMYTRYVVELNSHVLRHNHRPSANALANNNGNQMNQAGNDDLSINCLKISHIDDLNMALLRHWSILESIYHTIDLACLFKMWTNKGKKKLNEFLADLGLPLNECKQKYAYMDSSYKNDFKMVVGSENIKEKYKYLRFDFIKC
jgi:cell division control protein 45